MLNKMSNIFDILFSLYHIFKQLHLYNLFSYIYFIIKGHKIPKQSNVLLFEFFILFLISVELIPYSKSSII